ncbi:restriction endonuclease [Bacillus sp. NP157]|nr:restriction endonuclease [Bacillus sp. NP157]
MRRHAKPVRERWDDALSRVRWDDFERRVGDYYASQGYRVEHSGTGNGASQTDGGVDLRLYLDDAFIVVQCKHWNALQVPHNPVHELIGVMHTQGATGAILVTSGEFTRAALDSAARFPGITLVDGPAVRRMIGPIAEDFMRTPPPPPPPSWAPRHATHRGARPGNVRAAGLYAFAALAVVASVFIWSSLLQRIAGQAQDTRAVASIRPPATSFRLPVGSPPHVSARPRMPSYVAASTPPITHPDGRPAATGDVPRNAVDLKAWERQNAESMKILEKTTPALQSP